MCPRGYRRAAVGCGGGGRADRVSPVRTMFFLRVRTRGPSASGYVRMYVCRIAGVILALYWH
jgi:hypothetical protein